MIAIEGSYQDGTRSSAVPASLIFDGLDLTLRYADDTLKINPSELKMSDRLGSTPRRLSWDPNAAFITRDNDAVDELLVALNLEKPSKWIDRLERHTSVAIGAAIVAVVALSIFAVYGVPAVAKFVAIQAPESISRQLAESTLTTIDQILDPTELPLERRDELEAYFRSYGNVESIEFRKAGDLGANALCLSATTVVFTDEIVNLAENNEQLLAVYLHELGHARLKHVEQTILQSSAWIVLFSVVLGDVSSAGELILSLPLVVGQAAYSRTLESEADQFAIDALLEAGIDPGHLADALLLLQASHDHEEDEEHQEENTRKEAGTSETSWSERVFEYLSTHPATVDRVKHIRESSNREHARR